MQKHLLKHKNNELVTVRLNFVKEWNM